MVPRKEILYPIFLECCSYCDDPYWKLIFEDMAYGKTPYGLYINKGFLCCGYREKEFSYKIENKPPQQLYKEIHSLLTSKLGICSQKEKVRKKLRFLELENHIRQTQQDWVTIRKKNVKDILFEKYVIGMKQKYNLSNQQMKYLYHLILSGLIFKAITPEHIVFKDKEIQKIKGIRIVNKQCFLDESLYNSDATMVPQIILDKKMMSDTWSKYLKELQKYVYD